MYVYCLLIIDSISDIFYSINPIYIYKIDIQFLYNRYSSLPSDEGLAIALRNSDHISKIVNPNQCYPSFIHCKSDVLKNKTYSWYNQIPLHINDNYEFKLGYHRAQWPIHYQVKELASDIVMEILK